MPVGVGRASHHRKPEHSPVDSHREKCRSSAKESATEAGEPNRGEQRRHAVLALDMLLTVPWEDPMISPKQILVATDFSTASEAALLYGRSFARTYGATLHLLHIVDDIAARTAEMASRPDGHDH